MAIYVQIARTLFSSLFVWGFFVLFLVFCCYYCLFFNSAGNWIQGLWHAKPRVLLMSHIPRAIFFMLSPLLPQITSNRSLSFWKGVDPILVLALTLGNGGALHRSPPSSPSRKHCPKNAMLQDAGDWLVEDAHVAENWVRPGPFICTVHLSGDESRSLSAEKPRQSKCSETNSTTALAPLNHTTVVLVNPTV